MSKQYRLRTTNDYRATTDAARKVADLSVPAEDYVGPLTKEQLDAAMSDSYLLVHELDDKGNAKDAQPADESAEPEGTEKPAETAAETEAVADIKSEPDAAPAPSDKPKHGRSK